MDSPSASVRSHTFSIINNESFVQKCEDVLQGLRDMQKDGLQSLEKDVAMYFPRLDESYVAPRSPSAARRTISNALESLDSPVATTKRATGASARRRNVQFSEAAPAEPRSGRSLTQVEFGSAADFLAGKRGGAGTRTGAASGASSKIGTGGKSSSSEFTVSAADILAGLRKGKGNQATSAAAARVGGAPPLTMMGGGVGGLGGMQTTMDHLYREVRGGAGGPGRNDPLADVPIRNNAFTPGSTLTSVHG